jgi:drug/metabolite transporter (DMT)-like permease
MSTQRIRDGLLNTGVMASLAAAALFGLGTPVAKSLLASVDPWLLAGLLYGGSGIALTAVRLVRPRSRGKLVPSELGYLAGAVAAGGVAGPVLLMFGLSMMPAAGASLLLNAEGVFTALIAWLVFRENVDRRIALGMSAIAAGAFLLSWSPGLHAQQLWPSLLVLGACAAWAVDNNLTRKLSLLDATWLASVKGIFAGATNLAIALLIGASWPSVAHMSGALVVGALAYGVSLVLFVVGLRHLGAARTTAYFSTAPFVGALIAILWLHEPVTLQLIIAAGLMVLGLWLHLTERHEHEHLHTDLEHEHEHLHDEHHLHEHETPVVPGTRHAHRHRHVTLRHTHAHFPDAHHQHEHGNRG